MAFLSHLNNTDKNTDNYQHIVVGMPVLKEVWSIMSSSMKYGLIKWALKLATDDETSQIIFYNLFHSVVPVDVRSKATDHKKTKTWKQKQSPEKKAETIIAIIFMHHEKSN